jgi:AraC-like DNA-binding protein
MKDVDDVKYLILNDKDPSWGLTVNTVGYQHVRPNASYPLGFHPARYQFSVDYGRVLDEYQLIYLTRGQGSFRSSHLESATVREGNLILLFPSEWHNYAPDKKTGWDEHWIGFSGINIDNRVQHGFFSKQKPILNIGMNEEVLKLYGQALIIAKNQKTGYQQMLAGIVNLLLGYAYSLDRSYLLEDLEVTQQINKAKVIIREHFLERLTPESVAEQVCMGYSRFRHVFKEDTGCSPAQYIQQLKIQKCKELLTYTILSSQQIAYEVGFENPDYFCRLFKKKTGLTPIEYRAKTRKIIMEKHNESGKD